jgi:carboxypeptidase T
MKKKIKATGPILFLVLLSGPFLFFVRAPKSSAVPIAAPGPPLALPFRSPQALARDHGDELPQTIISVASDPVLEKRLRAVGLDLLFEWEGRTYILLSAADLGAVNRLGVPYIDETYRFPALKPSPYLPLTSLNGAYHSYREIEADLEDLQSAYPELAQLSSVGTTLENRKIYALKISDHVSADENEPEVLFLGCHHAREWISVEVPFLLARYLLENYDIDARIRRIVNQSEVWIVPLVNPDGLEYSIYFYRYWRKNRRLNADGTYGVDINRNYSYAWGYDDVGSSPEPASEVYRGPSPFSEPETRAVRDLVLSKNFRAMISYHSYSQDILYPWGYVEMPTDKNQLLNEIADNMSLLMQPVNGRLYAFGQAGALLYLTNGDATDWTFAISGMPSYTIELPPVDELHGGFFNSEQEIDPIFNENLPAALYLVEWSIQNFGQGGGPARIQETRDTPGPGEKTKAAARLIHRHER